MTTKVVPRTPATVLAVRTSVTEPAPKILVVTTRSLPSVRLTIVRRCWVSIQQELGKLHLTTFRQRHDGIITEQNLDLTVGCRAHRIVWKDGSAKLQWFPCRRVGRAHFSRALHRQYGANALIFLSPTLPRHTRHSQQRQHQCNTTYPASYAHRLKSPADGQRHKVAAIVKEVDVRLIPGVHIASGEGQIWPEVSETGRFHR